MKKSKRIQKFKISNSRRKTAWIAALCLIFLCAVNASAQNFEELTARLSGNTGQKRDALFEIRNLQSAEASRLALPALADSDDIVRATAVFSVIFLPSEETVRALSPLLEDKSDFVRREAALALGKTRSAQAVEPLIRTIQKDKIREVKNAAVIALGEIGDVSALDALVRILQKPTRRNEEFTRRSAARSIGQIAQIQQTGSEQKSTPESFLPEELKTTVKLNYKNLSKQFPEFRRAADFLIRTLQNRREVDDVRREAAFALGAIGDATALQILKNSLSAEDYYLAEIAEESLRKIYGKTE
jgi:FOG: HEAT repeat